ncbi:MAG TPA: MFS transporter [Bradyrhizobium sp.]|nr:MFS transporter [Bradyrhizobium sp.]
MNKSSISWASLFLLWTCGASLRLTVLAVPPVISIIQQDLHLSGTEIGLLSGIPVVLFAIAAAPGSTLVARFGVRSTLLSGLVITAIGAALRAASSNAWQLYLTSIVMSSGIAIMQPAMAAAVREWIPDRAAFGTAVYSNGMIIGEVIPVATMLPFVLPHLGSWRPALGIWSIPLIGTAILVALLNPGSSQRVVISRPVHWLPEWNSWLNWRIGLILGSVTSSYFCINGFLPAYLNGNGRPDLVSAALTALNLGQVPTSFLLLLIADRLQGRRWPYLLFGLLFILSVIGIMSSASYWTVLWAGLVGLTCGAALVLGLALAPLLCRNPDDVARTSAAAFAISYGFAMLISFVSGAAWDAAGNVDAALVPILLGAMPILILTPTLALERK